MTRASTSVSFVPDRLRSPLAMVVLAMLVEAPAHAYRIHELIKQRGKDAIVNVGQRNSVYQAIDRLLRAELIQVHTTSRGEGRPERVEYQLTKAGEKTLRDWLTATLAEPGREYPQFPAGLAFLMLLTPKEALAALEGRLERLAQEVDVESKTLKQAQKAGLPRLFLLDDEYRQVLARAELGWLRGFVQDLRDKKLVWSEKWLREIARRFG